MSIDSRCTCGYGSREGGAGKVPGLLTFVFAFLPVSELAPGAGQHQVDQGEFRVCFTGLLQQILRSQSIELAQFDQAERIESRRFAIQR